MSSRVISGALWQFLDSLGQVTPSSFVASSSRTSNKYQTEEKSRGENFRGSIVLIPLFSCPTYSNREKLSRESRSSSLVRSLLLKSSRGPGANTETFILRWNCHRNQNTDFFPFPGHVPERWFSPVPRFNVRSGRRNFARCPSRLFNVIYARFVESVHRDRFARALWAVKSLSFHRERNIFSGRGTLDLSLHFAMEGNLEKHSTFRCGRF